MGKMVHGISPKLLSSSEGGMHVHWIVVQIRDLPWWLPGLLALSIYWLPKLTLWPFRRFAWIEILVEEQAGMLAAISLFAFYVVYVLSWLTVPLAEVTLFIVACGVLGVVAWLIVAVVIFLMWLINLSLNDSSKEWIDHEKRESNESTALSYRDAFRVIRGGKNR